MSDKRVYLDMHIGDRDVHAKAQSEYDTTRALLSKNATIYGLPTSPEELSEEQQQILAEIDSSASLRYTAPAPLCVGRLVIKLDGATGLAKTRANFIALCTGEKGACKNAPNKKLHYLGCPMHRIVKGFVAQGGDLTRGDGSGGESIYGGKFNDDKEGLKRKMRRGTLAMANSGKNNMHTRDAPNAREAVPVASASFKRHNESQSCRILWHCIVQPRVEPHIRILSRSDQLNMGAYLEWHRQVIAGAKKRMELYSSIKNVLLRVSQYLVRSMGEIWSRVPILKGLTCCEAAQQSE